MTIESGFNGAWGTPTGKGPTYSGEMPGTSPNERFFVINGIVHSSTEPGVTPPDKQQREEIGFANRQPRTREEQAAGRIATAEQVKPAPTPIEFPTPDLTAYLVDAGSPTDPQHVQALREERSKHGNYYA